MSNNLSVLHLYRYCFGDNIGGIERYLEVLGHGCAERGIDVCMLVSQPRLLPWRVNEDRVGGMRVVRLPRLPEVLSGTLSPQMFTYARRLPADVVHVHWPHPAALALPALFDRMSRPARLVVTYHCDVVRQRRLLQLMRPMFDRLMRRADAIIVTSREVLETSEWLGDYRDKCRVIPYGIHLEEYALGEALAPRSQALRARFGSRTALFVGRLVGFKAVDVLLDAWSGVDGHLVIVGDGPCRRALERRAGRADLAGRVTFAGSVREELAAWYHAADLLVLPSRTRVESFGLVQVEAHACGVPVVSTRLGTGVEAVNVDGLTGLLVQPDDAAALGRAVSELLDDPERRQTMGEVARQRAHALYGHGLMVERTLALYAELACETERCVDVPTIRARPGEPAC